MTHIDDRASTGGPMVRIHKWAFTVQRSPGLEFPAARASDLVDAVSELVAGR
jgi:hypothetical protein